MINNHHALSLRAQCHLLHYNRSSYYYKKTEPKKEKKLINAILSIYNKYPVYGYRRIKSCLQEKINSKKILRIMHQLNIKAIPSQRVTTMRNKQVKMIYPYLLSNTTNLAINMVWQVDITYLRTQHGFVYLAAFIDRKSRYIISCSMNNIMDTMFIVSTLEHGINNYGAPTIIHSDQGSQFTSNEYINYLQKYNIQISMSGRGRSNDNAEIERFWRTLKYEYIYIYGLNTYSELKIGIKKFMNWYNKDRPHQALNYQTPETVFKKLLTKT